MTASEILSELISILVGGLVEFASRIGEGISALVTGLFFTGTGEAQTLSVFAILTIVFAGVALCIGLSKFILRWLTSFGKSK